MYSVKKVSLPYHHAIIEEQNTGDEGRLGVMYAVKKVSLPYHHAIIEEQKTGDECRLGVLTVARDYSTVVTGDERRLGVVYSVKKVSLPYHHAIIEDQNTGDECRLGVTYSVKKVSLPYHHAIIEERKTGDECRIGVLTVRSTGLQYCSLKTRARRFASHHRVVVSKLCPTLTPNIDYQLLKRPSATSVATVSSSNSAALIVAPSLVLIKNAPESLRCSE